MIDSLTTVTFLRAGDGGVDRYGNTRPGADVPTVVPGCIVFQTATTEVPAVGQDQTTASLTVLTPYGTDVISTDRAYIGTDAATVYQVVGSPTQYQNPWTGWKAGGTVFIKLVEG